MNLKMLLAGALTLVSGVAMAQSAPRVSPQGVVVNPVDTALKVNVRVDKGGANPLYIEGEKQRISVSVNQDAYVYVFNLQANGQISVLLPNGFSGGTPFLRANETRTFPPNGAGYELTIAAPFGQEKILAQRYRAFEVALLKLKDRLNSGDAKAKERAKVLEKALEASGDAAGIGGIDEALEELRNPVLVEARNLGRRQVDHARLDVETLWTPKQANDVVEYIRVDSPELLERPPTDVL
ncbi:MAG: DUF4384 domain-containing protein, partial [Pleurocapsa sp. SU_196_0]|nr:DUF4384 domain-containing protein [Pleurocapsa sp. SU_196_0]